MRIIISDTLGAIEGYKVKDSFDGIVWTTVDTLIYHSCSETDIKLTCTLSSIPENVKIIYINENLDPLIVEIMKGKGATIYKDESFMADKETLDFLVDNVGEMGCEIKDASADIETFNKFFSKIRTSEPDDAVQMLTNPQWVSTLDNVVENLTTNLALSEQSSPQLVTFLDNVNSHILRLEQKTTSTTAELQKLKEKVNSLSPKAVGQQAMSGAKALSYGTTQVPVVVPSVMYVRCFGDVNYLTTFLIAFQTWISAARGGNIPARLLVCRPPFANYMTRYSLLAKITPQSLTPLKDNKNNLFVTFEPNKTVLDAFFKEKALPLYFVIDFMQSDSPLIAGHMVKTFNGYSSPRIYREMTDNKMRAPVTRSFFSVDGVENSIIIPHIKNWQGLNDVEKRGALFQQCKEIYEKLYGILKG